MGGTPTAGGSQPQYTVHVDSVAPSSAELTIEAWNALKKGDFLSAIIALLDTAVGQIPLAIIRDIAGFVDVYFGAVLAAASSTEGVGQAAYFQLASLILDDFLGVEFSRSQMERLFAKSGDTTQAHGILGGQLYDILSKEFHFSSELTPSAEPARTFIGFLLAFVVRELNIGLLGEFFSFGQIDVLRDAGTNLARALGLGRLARRALTPLIDTMVQTPLDWQMKKTWTPTLLALGQALAAEDTNSPRSISFEENAARKGNHPKDLAILKETIYKHADVYDLSRLIRWHQVTEEDAIRYRAFENESKEQAKLRIQSQILSRADSDGSYAKSAIRSALASGAIDIVTATGELNKIGVSDLEITAMGIAAALARDARSRDVSLIEMMKAFESGIVALDEWTQYLLDAGYRDNAIRVLTYQLLDASANEHNRALASQFKAANNNARNLQRFRKGVGKVVGETSGIWDRDPSQDDVTSAFLQGFVTLEEARAWYESQGLSSGDIQSRLTDLTNALGSESGAPGT